MRPATKVVLATILVAAAAAACSRSVMQNRSAEKPKTEREVAASQIAQGHALVAQKQYDKAIDVFLEAASYSEATSEAVAGAVEAMDAKVSGFRLPDRLKEATVLWKRLPSTANREALRVRVQDYLTSAVAQQTKQAESLLADRRKFVQDMYDNDEGDVKATSAEGRILTESEVVDAESRMKDLQVPYTLMDLYIKHEAVAAALQRFADDDRDVLGQEEVDDSGLEELSNANGQLADSLWPVQRRLDKLRPEWRSQ